MKKYAYLLLLLILALGCNSAPTNPPGEPIAPAKIDDIAMDSLLQMFQRHNEDQLSLARKKGFIQVGANKVSVKVDVEFEEMNQGEHVYAAKFTTHLEGKASTDFEFGSIGFGADKEEAKTSSIVDWLQMWGYTFTQFLMDRKGASTVSQGTLFASRLMIRGSFPGNEGLFGDSTMTLKILDALEPHLPKQETFGMSVMVSMVPKRATEGQCWINNVEVPEATAKLIQLDWPKSDSGYMAKFYYILDRPKEAIGK